MSLKIKKYYVLLLLIISTFFAWAENKNILILYSYQYGSEWLDSLNKGIMQNYEIDNINTQKLFVEHLCIESNNVKEQLRMYYYYLKYKFAGKHIDHVLSYGNNSLLFLNEYKDSIFPNSQILYADISRYKVYYNKPNSEDVYIFSNLLLKENVMFIKLLLPNVEKIYLVLDECVLKQENYKNMITKILVAFPEIEFEYPQYYNTKLIIDKNKNVTNTEAILMLSSQRSINDMASYFSKAFYEFSESTIPTFTNNQLLIQKNVVGGVVASASKLGQISVEYTRNNNYIEKYKNIDWHKPILKSRNIKLHSISKKTIPTDAMIIKDEKKNNFDYTIWVIIFLIFVIVCLLVFIIIKYSGQRNETLSMNQYNEYLVSILRNLPSAIWLYDISKDVITTYGNPRLLKINNLDYREIFSANSTKDILHKYNILDNYSSSEPKILEIDDSVNGKQYLSKKIIPIYHNQEMICLMAILEDVTKREKYEKELHIRDSLLKTLIESVDLVYGKDDVFLILENIIDQLDLMTKISYFQISKFEDVQDDYKKQEAIYIWNKHIPDEVKTKPFISHKLLINRLKNKQTIIIPKEQNKNFNFPENVSIVIIPIYVSSSLWGYAYLEDSSISNWSNTIVEVIRVVVASVGIGIELKEIVTELVVSKAKAEESDRLKTAFLANMSHEIRTPLNGVVGYANLITRKKTTDEKKNKYCELIQRNTNQLIKIIDDIIDIAGIENNQLSIYKEEICVNLFLQSILQYAKDTCVEANKTNLEIKLTTPLPDKESFLFTDDTRLNQILNNLVSNAIKFTPEGSIEIGYYVDADDMVFYVKDTGIGIPKEKHDLVFERFRQVDDSLSRSYGGSGLGLAICYELVKLLNGKIWLVSDDKKGSAFYFTQSRKKEKDVQSNRFIKHEYSEELDLTGIKILVVDDNQDIFIYLEELLHITNVECQYSESGYDAINKIIEDNFDLILMDINMPDFDGIEASKTIKNIKPQLPIIAQTAYALKDEVKRIKENNFDGFITKPISYDVLINEIVRILRK